MPPAILVDSPALPVYDLGEGHPFAADRLRPLFALLRAHGLVAATELVRTPSADDDELRTVHERAYVEVLQRLEGGDDWDAIEAAPRFGLGSSDNPIVPGLHFASAAIAGATLACVRDVLEGRARAALNASGGLHHAMPALASGFCVYNDLAIGIREALARGVERVAYVDFDVHHGDGVEFVFRADPRVLTISFHETPRARWPYTGRVEDRGSGAGLGSAINVPFESGTCDASWQSIVAAVLEPAIARFRPQLLVTQHGCDTHFTDPLADLSLSTASADFAARLTRRLADTHCEGRWVATGGGGYQPIRVLPRAWTMLWCALADRALPTTVDPDWRCEFASRERERLPERFPDDPMDAAHGEPREREAAARNAAMLEALRRIHPDLLGDS
jgi:acetoin utilization protein AcuC